VPKANSWLRENADILLVKCETLEKKISSIDQVTADSLVFVPKGDFAMYLKGLRSVKLMLGAFCPQMHASAENTIADTCIPDLTTAL